MHRRHAALALVSLAASLVTAGCGGQEEIPKNAATAGYNPEAETRAADEAMEKLGRAQAKKKR
jgi:hypothetical protein